MSYKSILMIIAIVSILISSILYVVPVKQVIQVSASYGGCPQGGPGVHCFAIFYIPAHDETVMARVSLWWTPLIVTGACIVALVYPRAIKTVAKRRRTNKRN